MTEEQLQAIKMRAKYATDGPWKVVNSEESGVQIGTVWEHGQLKAGVPIVTTAHGKGGVTVYINHVNAEFIAHAREDVPTLIAEVELQKANAEQYLKDNVELYNENLILKNEIQRLREALGYYADEKNHTELRGTKIFGDVFYDKGKLARKALAGESK